ncbi:chorismate mutase [Nocardia blacklockiae]|uniref:chorismate mutase n=1 Tax=Nocardia blacklockiae TaxID=480036 RepID=UPI001895E0EF|nr:chorismate mutase [Nocardia blacklockiae]MBF6173547.1 chorismate mutase [Nocardia blacklockiae]
MRGAVLALTVALSFGAVSAATLPVTPVATAEVPAEHTAAPLADLVELVLARLNTADAVAAAKWVAAGRTGQPPVIDDPGREAEVYDSMAAAGADLGLPEPWVRQVFLGQIEANKIVQRGLHTWWRFDASTVPATPPDLAAVRPVIDRVNGDILRQLAARRAELTSADCPRQVAAAAVPVVAAGRADALHGTALVRAAAALCR